MPDPGIISSLEWTEKKSSSIITGFSALSLAFMLLATIYSFYKLRVVVKDINRLDALNYTPQERRDAAEDVCKELEKKYFRVSGLSALLAVVIGYMSPTSVWPQPQTALAILAVLQAQASSIAFCDTNQDELIDKIMDVFAVMVTLLVLVRVSYAYEWTIPHNPRTYTTIAFVMEGLCFLIWIFFACIMDVVQENFETLKIKRDTAIGITVAVTSTIAVILASISFVNSYSYDVNRSESTVFADPMIISTSTLVVGIFLLAIVVVIGTQKRRALNLLNARPGILELVPRCLRYTNVAI